MKFKIQTQTEVETDVVGYYSSGLNYYYFTEHDYFICVFRGSNYKTIEYKPSTYAPSLIGTEITKEEFMEVYKEAQTYIHNVVYSL